MPTEPTSLPVRTIGVLRSDFDQKFGTPRQAGLAPSARATLTLDPETARGLDGIETWSHLWLLFWFHLNRDAEVRWRVRPPRLGGNDKVGVFATRSPYRPTPIGLSAVQLEAVERHDDGCVTLVLRGADLVDGTPVVDIKPYLPYADAIPSARAQWSEAAPGHLVVRWSEGAFDKASALGIDALITEVIRQDPRPAYRKGNPDDRTYGARLRGHEVRWTMLTTDEAIVLTLEEPS